MATHTQLLLLVDQFSFNKQTSFHHTHQLHRLDSVLILRRTDTHTHRYRVQLMTGETTRADVDWKASYIHVGKESLQLCEGDEVVGIGGAQLIE